LPIIKPRTSPLEATLYQPDRPGQPLDPDVISAELHRHARLPGQGLIAFDPDDRASGRFYEGIDFAFELPVEMQRAVVRKR
jgi:hypothetical protein